MNQLNPTGVAIMFAQGAPELKSLLLHSGYGDVLINLVTNIVLSEIKKLPGVGEVFDRFEA